MSKETKASPFPQIPLSRVGTPDDLAKAAVFLASDDSSYVTRSELFVDGGVASGAEAMIEHLQLVIAKMRQEMFGPRSARSQRLLDHVELQLEELAAAHSEDAPGRRRQELAHVRREAGDIFGFGSL